MKLVRGRYVNLGKPPRPRWPRPRWQALGILLIFLTVGLFPGTALADDTPSVLVRTRLHPENPVVGQQVEFQVEVFVDTWFASASQFPDIQIDDAIALLPSSASFNFSERIEGRTFVGQRRTYFVFPQLPGRYAIPPLTIQVVPAQPGQPTSEPVSLVTPAVDFLAQLPPALAAQSDQPVVATPQLHVTTRLQSQGNGDITQPHSMRVGDTLSQTVTVQASDTLASALPPIAVSDRPGLSAYPAPPQLKNQFNRGQFVASRRDRIDYVAEKPGRYQLPPQMITWWNTRTQTLQTAVIPAIDVRVKPTPEQFFIQLLPGLIGLLVLIGGLIYLRPSLHARWHAYRQHQRASEPAQWRRLRQVCQTNAPHAIWIQLMQWLASTRPAETVTLEQFLDQIQNPALAQLIRTLELTLYGPADRHADSPTFSGQDLSIALQSIRQQWLNRRSIGHAQAITDLPSLNPTGL